MTKIDWINVYFDNAKNTSDTYMQNVWAKILARELEMPGSFSYKTLDIVRNLSGKEFKVFERMLELTIDDFIPSDEELCSRNGVSYLDTVLLSENGLLDYNTSVYSRDIEPEGVDGFTKNSYFIKIFNSTEEMKKIKLEVRLLTQAAKELSKVADFEKKG